jgi:hypothetical protein
MNEAIIELYTKHGVKIKKLMQGGEYEKKEVVISFCIGYNYGNYYYYTSICMEAKHSCIFR